MRKNVDAPGARQMLGEHDVSDLIGLRGVVINAAVEVTELDGEHSIEVPDLEALAATAAVVRCLASVRLRGAELRAIRHIADWTAADLASKLGERTSPETISRWENEKQPMSGYAEKVFRLVVCEALHRKAPGVDYQSAALADLQIYDPWKADTSYELPFLALERVKVRDEERRLIEAWETQAPQKKAAA